MGRNEKGKLGIRKPKGVPGDIQRSVGKLSDAIGQVRKLETLRTAQGQVREFHAAHSFATPDQLVKHMLSSEYKQIVLDWSFSALNSQQSLHDLTRYHKEVHEAYRKHRRDVLTNADALLNEADTDIKILENVNSSREAGLYAAIKEIAGYAKAGFPLSVETITKIDRFFTQEQVSKNPELITFLLYLATIHPKDRAEMNDIRHQNKNNPTVIALLEDTEKVLRKYFDEYYNKKYVHRLLAAAAHRRSSEPVPTDNPVLTALIGVYCLDAVVGTSLLPTSWEALLKREFIPGLSPESKAVLTAYQYERYARRLPDWAQELETDHSLFLARLPESYATGRALHLAEHVSQLAMESSQTGENNPGLAITHFGDIQKAVKQVYQADRKMVELGTFADTQVLLYSQRSNFINVVFTRGDDVLILQLAFEGIIVGLPADFSGDASQMQRFVQQLVVEYANKQKILPQAKPVVEPRKPAVAKPATETLQESAVQDKQASLPSNTLAIPKKRRDANRLGVRVMKSEPDKGVKLPTTPQPETNTAEEQNGFVRTTVPRKYLEKIQANGLEQVVRIAQNKIDLEANNHVSHLGRRRENKFTYVVLIKGIQYTIYLRKEKENSKLVIYHAEKTR